MARMKLPCARAISHPWGRATSTSPSHSRRAVSSSPLAISRNFAVVLTSDSALRGGVTASRAGSSSWFTSLAGQLSLSSAHAAITRHSTSSSSPVPACQVEPLLDGVRGEEHAARHLQLERPT